MSLGLKDRTRKKTLKLLKGLSSQEVISLSQQVISNALKAKSFQKLLGIPALNVGLYQALPRELDLRYLESTLKSQGWKLHFPRIVVQGSTKELEFVEVPGTQESHWEWTTGSYGILEPHPDLKAIAPEKMDLFFVPGVAYGQSGERIGMGAGYYDRFLKKAPQALRIALAFDVQVHSELEQDPWDEPVHWILTEKSEYQGPWMKQWKKWKTK